MKIVKCTACLFEVILSSTKTSLQLLYEYTCIQYMRTFTDFVTNIVYAVSAGGNVTCTAL